METMSPKQSTMKTDESNKQLSKSKKKTRRFLKPKGKIVKKPLNKISKLGESSTPMPTSTKRTSNSPKTESQIAKKSPNENPKLLNSKKMKKAKNLVKKSSNENSKNVDNKETQKPQNIEPEVTKDLAESSNKVKEVKGSSTIQSKTDGMKKLGGFIFMCNRTTKPDCYHYRVMGVQAHKKELVMGVKPGMKLFLFDVDLKLLYGIYKATSAAGMKLEPSAFGGAFPLQIRFEVFKDCLPLPERVFKVAIKDNYDERTRKFSTDLTTDQVKELSNLFKPAPWLHSNAPSSAPEPHGPSEYENRQLSKHPAASPPLLLTEHEYRSYGLRGDRHKNPTPLPPPYDPYKPTIYEPYQPTPYEPYQPTAHEPYQPTAYEPHQPMAYEAYVPTAYNPSTIDQARDGARSNMLFPSEKDYRTYGLKGRQENPASVTPNIDTMNPPFYPSDHYNSYSQNPSSVDMYLSRPQPAPSDYYRYEPYDPTLIEHGESTLPEGLYSANASNLLSEYNQHGHHGSGELEHRPDAPVSSRYAFAGPSVRYR